MGDDVASSDTDAEEAPVPRRPIWRRPVPMAVSAVLLVALVGFVAWLAVEGRAVKSNLEQARADAVQTKEALSKGRVEDAAKYASSVQGHAQNAGRAAHSFPWAVAAQVPWLGSPFRASQQISDVVLGFATDVLEPSTHIGLALSPDHLLSGSRLDVHLLRNEAPAISKLSTEATRLDAEAGAIAEPTYLSSVADARSKLQSQIASIAKILQTTSLAAQLAPSMMGADGPTTYFMGFQTNAEARGTGGIVGGFGILRFNDGAPSVETLGPNTELLGPFQPIDLGPDFADGYGYTNPTTDIRNSNMSSHFPWAAQIWKSMWAQDSHVNVDGVISIDPVALSYILGATGPVKLADGEEITKDNVVQLTESTAYNRFPTDQVARKKYLQDIAAEVVKKMTRSLESPRALLEGLGKAIGERRIAVWSTSEANQKLLEQTPLAHEIPDDAAPYAEVVMNNLAGNKMDYYLKRQITYTAESCSGATRKSTISIKLTNDAPDTPLPEYVAGALGLSRDVPMTMPSGSMLTSVRLIATKGAQLTKAASNDQEMPVFTSSERGHPTYEVQVVIPPRQSGTLTFQLSEPTAAGAARVPIQPLADHVETDIRVPACS